MPPKKAASGAKNAKAGKKGSSGTAKAGTAVQSALSMSRTAAAAADVQRELREEEAPVDPRHAGLDSAAGADGVGAASADDAAALKGTARNREAEAQQFLRSMGEHVDTRRTGIDMEQDDEGIGAGLFDEMGDDDSDGEAGVDESFRPLAAAVPADRVQLVSAQAATGTAHQSLFLGHNRNSVTAVAAHGDCVVYADKLGVVTKVTLPALSSSGAAAQATPVREMFLPHVDQPVLSVAISDTSSSRRNRGLTRTTADLSVTSFVAVGTAKGLVRIWNFATMEHVGDLTLHRAAVMSLTFRMNTSTLISVSADKVVRVWNVHSMAPMDRLFGHKSTINGVSALRSEKCVTASDDRTPHMWKLDKATQIAFATLPSPCDAVTMIDDSAFVVGCRNGTLALFDSMKKNPVWRKEFAHGYGWGGDGTGLERESRSAVDRFGVAEPPVNACDAFGNGITALAAVPFSDLVVSGSSDGFLRIWRYRCHDNDPEMPFHARELQQVGQAAVFGFVNAIAFRQQGKEILCGVGKEPRNGRWQVQRAARNGVQRVPLSFAAGDGFKVKTQQEAAPEPSNPAEEMASLQRLIAQARAPTEREQMLRQRAEGPPAGSKKAGGAAAGGKKRAGKGKSAAQASASGASAAAAATAPSSSAAPASSSSLEQPAVATTPARKSLGKSSGSPAAAAVQAATTPAARVSATVGATPMTPKSASKKLAATSGSAKKASTGKKKRPASP